MSIGHPNMSIYPTLWCRSLYVCLTGQKFHPRKLKLTYSEFFSRLEKFWQYKTQRHLLEIMIIIIYQAALPLTGIYCYTDLQTLPTEQTYRYIPPHPIKVSKWKDPPKVKLKVPVTLFPIVVSLFRKISAMISLAQNHEIVIFHLLRRNCPRCRLSLILSHHLCLTTHPPP